MHFCFPMSIFPYAHPQFGFVSYVPNLGSFDYCSLRSWTSMACLIKPFWFLSLNLLGFKKVKNVKTYAIRRPMLMKSSDIRMRKNMNKLLNSQ